MVHVLGFFQSPVLKFGRDFTGCRITRPVGRFVPKLSAPSGKCRNELPLPVDLPVGWWGFGVFLWGFFRVGGVV